MIGLACATISVDGFGDVDFAKTFQVMPQIGFKYVELNCWYARNFTPAKMRDLKARGEAAGLIPMAIHCASFGADNPMDMSVDVSHKIRVMECLQELGAKRLVASGAARGTKGGVKTIIAELKELVPVAQELGMMICLENHCNNNLEYIEDYAAIFEAIPETCVGLCIDTGHFEASYVDLNVLIDVFHDRVNHLHMKENNGKGEKKFVRFKEGTTDNLRVVERMIGYGYEGFITIELSPEIGEHDGRPFTLDDLVLPYEMFKTYERT